MLTHDSRHCLIQNGGEEHHSDGDDDEHNNDHNVNDNHGVQINEIIEVGEPDHNGNEPVQEDNPNQNEIILPEDFIEDEPMHNMYSDELEMNELYNSFPSFTNVAGSETDLSTPQSPQPQKGKDENPEDMLDLYTDFDATDVANERAKCKRKAVENPREMGHKKLSIREKGESSGSNSTGSIQIRGAMGPKPPDSQ